MGTYIMQYARMVDVHPLICVVGNGIELAERFLEPEKGDVVVDYRKGDDAVVQGIRSALKGEKLEYAFDAVSAHGSWINIAQVLGPPRQDHAGPSRYARRAVTDRRANVHHGRQPVERLAIPEKWCARRSGP